MSRTLVILNDPPYGSERTYNGLRLAEELAKRAGEQVRVFLMGDAASSARRGQRVPAGYYSVEAMLHALAGRGGEVFVCGSCMDSRGLEEANLVEGTHRGSIDLLSDWTLWADRIVSF